MNLAVNIVKVGFVSAKNSLEFELNISVLVHSPVAAECCAFRTACHVSFRRSSELWLFLPLHSYYGVVACTALLITAFRQ